MESHPIKVAAARTGLSAHVIRAWEKRYGAIVPGRTDTNRRLYSDADVNRLRLLRAATEGGRGIGQIASLSSDELEVLVGEDREAARRPAPGRRTTGGKADSERYLEDCLEAVRDLDARTLETNILRASVALPAVRLVADVLVPLMIKVGEAWQSGELRIAQEHLASAVVRTYLGHLISSFRPDDRAPELLVATPAGQAHEGGALAVAATAASEGWRVTYLGPDLPAEEIANAAIINRVRAVALSVVYPSDDVRLVPELEGLRRLLPPELPVLIGGTAAGSYAPSIDRPGIIYVPDLAALQRELQTLRANTG